MYQILDVQQQTETWHEIRTNRIGASDAAVILGLSPYKTPKQLFSEKMFGYMQIVTPQMQRGIDLEPEARKLFTEITGIQVTPMTLLDNRDWIMASLDGFSNDKTTAVEIKCPNKIAHRAAMDGHIPDHYYPQLQHQIEVANIEHMYYFSYNGKNGAVVKVFRNDAFIKDMLVKEYEFWERMQEINPPED